MNTSHTFKEDNKMVGRVAGAPKPGGAATVGHVGLTVVEGTVVFAEAFLMVNKQIKELVDFEAIMLGFKPIKGTVMYISPSKKQLMHIYLCLAYLAEVEYGKLKPVEGKLIAITPGYTYYHEQSKTIFWRDEQSNEWLTHTYEQPAPTQ